MNNYPYQNRSFSNNNKRFTWKTPEELKYPRNEWIKVEEVLVVGEEGNLGVMKIDQARQLAADRELDIILVAPNAKIPVCKITTWSKFLYDLKKREKQAYKNKQKELKEFRFGTYIDDGDKNRLIKRAKEFLDKGHNVKITVSRKGRTPMEDSKMLLNELLTALSVYSSIDSSPSYNGRMISMILKGELKKTSKSNGKIKNEENSGKKVQDDKTKGK